MTEHLLNRHLRLALEDAGLTVELGREDLVALTVELHVAPAPHGGFKIHDGTGAKLVSDTGAPITDLDALVQHLARTKPEHFRQPQVTAQKPETTAITAMNYSQAMQACREGRITEAELRAYRGPIRRGA